MKIRTLTSLTRLFPRRRRPTPVSIAMLVIILIGMILTSSDAVETAEPQVDTQEVLAVTSAKEEGLVTRVVDGDTIVVGLLDKEVKVRLIGIDSPESVDPRKPVECFGLEASAHLNDLIAGKRVRLDGDSSQADVDRYGRLLRYVYLGDENINRTMILDGFAFEYTYQDNPYLFQAGFRQAQAEARFEKRGLWAEGACEPNQNQL